MIYLLHGSDIISSRSFLLNFKRNYSDFSTIDANGAGLAKISIPQTDSLFAEKRLVIIENLIPKDNEPLKKADNLDFLIWTKEQVKPPSWVDKSWLFKQTDFLSSFKLGDQTILGQKKGALTTLKKLLDQKTAGELIIGSLVRQLRLISLVLKGEESQVSKSSFVVDKTKEMAKNWTIRKIKRALLLILRTDWEIKSGVIHPESGLTILVSQLSDLGKIS